MENQNKLILKHKYFNNKWFARWARIYYYEKYIMFPIRQKAVKFINLTKPHKIIDIACGTGSQGYEFALHGHDVIGVDLSPDMLAQAKRKETPNLKLKFKHADATDLPFPKNSFDVASISFGLHDMPYEIELKVLKEARRVVKPKGKILIVEYMEPGKTIWSWLFYPIFRVYETKYWSLFMKRGLDKILHDAGLRKSSETDSFRLFQIVLIINNK